MEQLDIILYVLFFVCGLAVGSFLEVVTYRVPRKISIVRPGSYCPSCQSRIAFYDNIPLLSYIILRGRCRSCRVRIPVTSFIVELLTGLLFLLNYFFFGISIMTVLGIILCCILIAVSFIDIEFIGPNTGSQGTNHGTDLVMAQHFFQSRLFHVKDLAF